MFDNMPSANPQVTNGRVKALAVTTQKRSPLARCADHRGIHQVGGPVQV